MIKTIVNDGPALYSGVVTYAQLPKRFFGGATPVEHHVAVLWWSWVTLSGLFELFNESFFED